MILSFIMTPFVVHPRLQPLQLIKTSMTRNDDVSTRYCCVLSYYISDSTLLCAEENLADIRFFFTPERYVRIMTVQIPCLSGDILLQIAETDIHRTHQYRNVTRWAQIDPDLYQNAAFNQKLVNNLVRLDMQTGYPRFLIQAILDGSLSAVEQVSRSHSDSQMQAWESSLNQSVRPIVGQLVCSEPDIAPSGKQVAVLGYEQAYAAKVLATTECRGTYNVNISLDFPRFKSKAQESFYLDCMRSNVSSSYAAGPGEETRGWRIIDALCVICDRLRVAAEGTGEDQSRSLLLDKLVNQFLGDLRAGKSRKRSQTRRPRPRVAQKALVMP